MELEEVLREAVGDVEQFLQVAVVGRHRRPYDDQLQPGIVLGAPEGREARASPRVLLELREQNVPEREAIRQARRVFDIPRAR